MNNTNINISSRQSKTKVMVVTGMFTALICALSLIAIPTSTVPFTLSLLAIFLTGALLPPRQALLSALVYILIGTIGLPVFAGMKGGVAALLGQTGGYIMSYPIMTFVTSLSFRLTKKHKTLVLILGMIISLSICYLLGTLWFSHITGIGFLPSLTLCVAPYVLFDLLKIALATSFSSIIRKLGIITI